MQAARATREKRERDRPNKTMSSENKASAAVPARPPTMPTPPNEAPPPSTFAAYVFGRLRNPMDALGLAFVYALFVLVGGWVPLVAGHAVVRAALGGLSRLPGCAWADRGPTATVLSAGLPAVLLFAGLLHCDYGRLDREWRASARARASSP